MVLIRGGCVGFLFGLALAYVLKGKHYWKNLAAQWAAKKKKKRGQGAPKHQSIFASVISIFFLLKKESTKPPARRRRRFFLACLAESAWYTFPLEGCYVFGSARKQSRSTFVRNSISARFFFFSRPSSPLPPALLAFSDEENVWKRLVHKPWPPLTSEKPDTNTNFGFLEQVVVFGICAVRAR